MTRSDTSPDHEGPHHRHNAAFEMLNALSMTVGRDSVATGVADLAELTADDQVADIGCAPGAAARVAASRWQMHATGVDPLLAMLRLGRWLNALPDTRSVASVMGPPKASRSPAVAPRCCGRPAQSNTGAIVLGLAEPFRVLAPGGRLLLVERIVRPNAYGGLAGRAFYATDPSPDPHA